MIPSFIDPKYKMHPTVIVTGGTCGLGYNLVQRFSAKGCPVIFTSRCKKRIDNVTNTITGDVIGVRHVSEAFKLCKPDIVINNAACSGGYLRFIELDPEEANEIVTTNLTLTANKNATEPSRSPATEPHHRQWICRRCPLDCTNNDELDT